MLGLYFLNLYKIKTKIKFLKQKYLEQINKTSHLKNTSAFGVGVWITYLDN